MSSSAPVPVLGLKFRPIDPRKVPLADGGAIEIRIGQVGLGPKLDAIAAALATVKEAHRDEMSAEAWAAIGRAQDQIAHAVLTRNKGITDRLDLPARRVAG